MAFWISAAFSNIQFTFPNYNMLAKIILDQHTDIVSLLPAESTVVSLDKFKLVYT